jgi:hypothetical protein
MGIKHSGSSQLEQGPLTQTWNQTVLKHLLSTLEAAVSPANLEVFQQLITEQILVTDRLSSLIRVVWYRQQHHQARFFPDALVIGCEPFRVRLSELMLDLVLLTKTVCTA